MEQDRSISLYGTKLDTFPLAESKPAAKLLLCLTNEECMTYRRLQSVQHTNTVIPSLNIHSRERNPYIHTSEIPTNSNKGLPPREASKIDPSRGHPHRFCACSCGPQAPARPEIASHRSGTRKGSGGHRLWSSRRPDAGPLCLWCLRAGAQSIRLPLQGRFTSRVNS